MLLYIISFHRFFFSKSRNILHCYYFKTLSRIRHPNIVRLYGFISNPEYDVLLLEYVDAGDLYSHLMILEKKDKLSSTVRVNILCQVARALHFLQSGGQKQKYEFIHGDIKSKNICLDRNYTPKLIDFGGVKVNAVREGGDKSIRNSILQNEAPVVTTSYTCPAYLDQMIPEFEAKCDVYSFGVVMFELILGEVQPCSGGDLVLRYKDAKSLERKRDANAGDEWNFIMGMMTELAMECVTSYDLEKSLVGFRRWNR